MSTPLASVQALYTDEQLEIKRQHIFDAIERQANLEVTQETLLSAERMWLLSEYVHKQLCRFPNWINELQVSAESLEAPSLAQLYAGEDAWGRPATAVDLPDWDEPTLMRQLRRYRHWWMVRLICSDLEQSVSLETLTAHLSKLADVAVNASQQWSMRHYQALYGLPLDRAGQAQKLIVIGMGKLGGFELNLSSDIDLVFAFREHGETQGGKKSLSHQEYFTKIGQKLIQHLDQVNAEGFVFRVDMRLRPFGQSGALVMNMDSLENYYQDQGRDWERYAMIKARVMAGDALDIKEFEALRRPFVYRKYLDFGAIGALRDLKAMIAKEVRRKGIEHNIKLGEGGIREVEFIVQALQILHGGRDQGLQTPALFKVLPVLGQDGYLPDEEVQDLLDAYRYLRRVEHALQGYADEQTQLLPDDALAQTRLAYQVGESDWQALDTRLWQHRHKVHEYFKALIDDGEDSATDAEQEEVWRVILKQPDDLDSIQEALQKVAWQEADAIAKRLQQFLTSRSVAFMQPIGQERLAVFLAALIYCLEEEEQPDRVLERIIPIMEAVTRRTAYLVLLSENQSAIGHLIRLCRESVWFSEAISNSPALLDELLDANTLFSPPSKAQMGQELEQILLRLPEEDEEAHMDAMRRFRRSIILRIAACDITGVLPLMKVSDHLTWLAEVLLEKVLLQSWHYLSQRHGYPTRAGEPVMAPEMAIVGYGKSGGIELGYDSDLDLVFIHNAEGKGYTNGERSVDNLVFYTRLGQRIIHMLTSFTSAGRLYEVDMRLRPSGNSGLLVASLEAFQEYQEKEAWVWEHQALCRARALAGDPAVVSEFERIRAKILSRERDCQALKQDVIKMREKMRAHLDTGGEGKGFDLKQGAGGIIDIEFMVQYLVLAWSCQYPALMTYSDNIRQLEAASDSGLIESGQMLQMKEAYTFYRATAHRQTLQKQGRVVPVETLEANQALIAQYWDAFVAKPC
ncbi:bifunctional [glutamate--ammonia ligase]-adenylyl-L-tyrosine phosphorylase/[glutamate--ammonia-ligase] adenylyltransferase [Marinomonas ostreistagni]|uniref:bifunctional [glutamate--ammonia ligase]-adenylyl-L-tyrosine phosphorylase/[glutamate--ammonia-ligase] adenylyltransferase n=1 Tax=Marinomonas ostreistagni TaxID=359209 RepID=UPI00194FFF86|nr:bifunctional [glutamate--ammonia ligase]-adenylyl-L-tyrosine phosphorylase/[glutamate--ammonia-ligase] adenylyltransferase [Marinomonas ostreistagni]MBM6551406.1 bifunctional [glutamate--ammonia ligase]-adenylyl-L-tyrosine phosphorylase/[glutamate--ammonia-ligase] adenylyltransferase [Marinomonas ostreistagni]